jgi:hypothetical protein
VRSYKVYNCDEADASPIARNAMSETCYMQGNFTYPSSALARLAQCTGSRAWIEKSGNDVTDELIATASSQIKAKLAEQSLSYDMKYGRLKRGVKRG